jgi:large subunit ribosomal protein L6
MSRIGKLPITIPTGVKVEVQGTHIKVLGKKGSLERNIRPEIEIQQDDSTINCTPKGTSKKVLAFWGMTRSLLHNRLLVSIKAFQKNSWSRALVIALMSQATHSH